MSRESRKETAWILWNMFLQRLGLVRLKHHKVLIEQFARLAEKYAELRDENHRRDIATPDEYTIEVEFDSLLPEARKKRNE